MSTFIILNRWVVPYKQKAVLKVWLPHVKKNEISIQCCYNCVTCRKLWSSKTHTEFRYTVLTEIHWKVCPTLLLLSVSCYFSSSKYSSEYLIFFFFSLFPFNINCLNMHKQNKDTLRTSMLQSIWIYFIIFEPPGTRCVRFSLFYMQKRKPIIFSLKRRDCHSR